jgi:transposase
MKKSTSDLVSEIKQIHSQYLEEVGNGGYKVWPKSIKDRVFELVDGVNSIKVASEMCGISAHTIYQWRSDQKKSNFKSLTVVNQQSKSPTVTVPKAKPILKSKEQSPTVTVTTPQGFTIKGLSSDEAVEILLKLGVR